VASPVKSSSVAVLVTIAFSMIGVVGELFPEARQHPACSHCERDGFFSASWWSSANHATTLNWPESSSWWASLILLMRFT